MKTDIHKSDSITRANFKFIGPFRTSIHFMYDNEKNVFKFIKEKMNIEHKLSAGVSFKYNTENNGMTYCICINADKINIKNNFFISILSHELIHLSIERLKDLGIISDNNSIHSNTGLEECLTNFHADVALSILNKLFKDKIDKRMYYHKI